MIEHKVYVFGDCDAFVHVYRDRCRWSIWVVNVWHSHTMSRKETADLIRKHKRNGTRIRIGGE